MDSIIETIIHTPWWVYVLFVYLVVTGLNATKPTVVYLPKLVIIPTIFTLMSIQTLVATVTISLFSVTCWALSIFSGIAIIWLIVCRTKIKADKKNLLIQLPGSWSTLILILIIFSSKYYLGYEAAVHPGLDTDINFKMTMLILSGLCTGSFLGKLFYYLYRFRHETHIDLKY